MGTERDDLEKLRRLKQLHEKQAQAMGGQTEVVATNPGDILGKTLTALQPTVLPTAGELGGLYAGMQSGPLAPYLTPILPPIFAGAGELGNQYLGITPPSKSAIAREMAYTSLGNMLGVGARTIRPFATPASASQMAQHVAQESSEALLKRLTSATGDVDALFKIARNLPGSVPVSQASSYINEFEQKVLPSLSSNAQEGLREFTTFSSKLKDDIRASHGALTPAQLQSELEQLKIQADNASGSLLHHYDELKSALRRDLERAAAGPGGKITTEAAQALLTARAASQRTAVLNKVGDIFTSSLRAKPGFETLELNAKSMIDKLRKLEGGAYKAAFTQAERDEIESLMKKIIHVPRLTEHLSGGPVGLAVRSAKLGGQAAAASYMFGGGGRTAAIAGFAAGALPGLRDFGHVLGVVLSLPEGRAVMRALLDSSKGTLTPRVMSTLGAFAGALQTGLSHRREQEMKARAADKPAFLFGEQTLQPAP